MFQPFFTFTLDNNLKLSYCYFFQKFKASVKPSNNWGPKDPISRLNWIQWSSKAQQGEKDFTLKRKGTRDYTKSVKKNKKIKAASEMSAAIQGVYTQNGRDNVSDGNIYAEVPERMTPNQRINNFSWNEHTSPRKNNGNMTSEMNRYDKNSFQEIPLPNSLNLYTSNPIQRPINPLSQTNRSRGKYEDMGSLNKGPYIISDNEVDHICFRKNSENNNASEL